MKIKAKFLIMLVLAVFTILLIGTTNVNATCQGAVESGKIEKNSLDFIEDSITLNMQEDSLEKLEEKVYNQIVEKLKEKGITISNNSNDFSKGALTVDFDVVASDTDNDEPFYIDKIFVNLSNGETSANRKQLNVNWTNKIAINENDKQNIINMLINLGFDKNNRGDYEYISYYYDELGETRNRSDILEKITDKSISILQGGGSQGPEYDFGFSYVGQGTYYLIKNNICYARISCVYDGQAQITVPTNVEDTDSAYIDYATPIIQNYLKEQEDSRIIKLQKLNGYWFKVSTNGTNDEDYIVIKKSDGAYVGNNIYINGLTKSMDVTVVTKQNEAMETELKNKGYSNILGAYEFTLAGTDSLITPMDITFNLGTQYNGKTVYVLHQKKDSSYENFEETVTDGKITIKVNELSPFVLGMKEASSDVNSENTTKTETNILYYIIPIAIILVIVIIVLIKKGKK